MSDRRRSAARAADRSCAPAAPPYWRQPAAKTTRKVCNVCNLARFLLACPATWLDSSWATDDNLAIFFLVYPVIWLDSIWGTESFCKKWDTLNKTASKICSLAGTYSCFLTSISSSLAKSGRVAKKKKVSAIWLE